MNYIVGRLIQVLTEEEAFWVFVIIMEKYLPLDYMLDGMTGALTDQKVFDTIAKIRYPQVIEKLKEIKAEKGCELSSRTIFSNQVVSWF
mmetsp:Transcript_32992/g.50511  ORF Transcript_32992/g.50511 Transcript_32992/m.50511 type:complete len:89 (+) Transcript_32992:962-1228(+)